MLQNTRLTYPWEDHGFLSLAHIITLVILLCVDICECICMTVWCTGLRYHAMNRENVISSPALCTKPTGRPWASHFSLSPRNSLEGSAHTQKHTSHKAFMHTHTLIQTLVVLCMCV